MNANELSMSFDPHTIQHLGIKMYSNLPAAIAELIANSYDADAHKVEVNLVCKNGVREIIVKDDGHGMTFDEINDCFLRIGRNRRTENMAKSPGGRFATGKKGLGKLALFGIGNEIKVITKKQGGNEKVCFSLKWHEILECAGRNYTPRSSRENDNQPGGYTEITISDLKRKTPFDPEGLAKTLAKMFNFLGADFNVSILHNGVKPILVDNKLKYAGIEPQFTWEYPKDFCLSEIEYQHSREILGKIISTEKPLPPNLRGITLFAHGRLVNLPEFFGRPESSHFYSYTTGWLEIDFIDVDNSLGDDDLISTNRQSLDWEKDETLLLRDFLQGVLAYVQGDWRKKRKEISKKNTTATTGIDRDKWLSTIPKDKASIIANALESAADPDSKDDAVTIFERAIHDIVPEYAALHWRFLNEKIKSSEVVERLYQQENYFQAAAEAVKSYILIVKKLSKIQNCTDRPLMMQAFGCNEKDKTGKITKERPISLTNRSDAIENDIEEGQQFYSTGLVVGFKNPVVSHSTEEDLKRRGLFSEKDCLDILSLLSHLMDRLEKRISPP